MLGFPAGDDGVDCPRRARRAVKARAPMRLAGIPFAVSAVVSAVLSAGLLRAPGACAGAIVVAKSSTISHLSADEASRVFDGLQRHLDGRTVVVVYQSSGPTREEFDGKILGKTTAEVNAYMAAMIFTGRASPPLEVPGDDRVKQAINSRPDTVGYISDSAVDESVRVLLRY
jgi:hypothetical protein